MKRASSILVVFILVFAMFAPSAFAAQTDVNLPAPTTGVKQKYENAAHPSRVLNVSTYGTPATGDAVTIWSWSNNATQWWCNVSNGYNGSGWTTYRVVLFQYPNLALNYNQATYRCTVYPFASNSTSDYTITYLTGVSGYLLQLNAYGRYLGVTGDTLGTNCIWYLPKTSPTAEECWNIYNI